MDGVISGDAVLMSYLLEAVGPVSSPVRAPGWPDTITSENVVEVVNRDTFLTTSQARSDRWQTVTGAALWEAVLTRPWRPQALATALSRGVEERHLQVFAADPAGRRRWSISVRPARWRSLRTSRRWSCCRASRTTAPATSSRGRSRPSQEELPDGGTEVTVDVTLQNSAPTGPPSILLGTPTSQASEGLFQAQLQVYLPLGATVVSSTVDGGPGVARSGRGGVRPADGDPVPRGAGGRHDDGDGRLPPAMSDSASGAYRGNDLRPSEEDIGRCLSKNTVVKAQEREGRDPDSSVGGSAFVSHQAKMSERMATGRLYRQGGKRVFDVAVTTLALIVLSPVVIVVAM